MISLLTGEQLFHKILHIYCGWLLKETSCCVTANFVFCSHVSSLSDRIGVSIFQQVYPWANDSSGGSFSGGTLKHVKNVLNFARDHGKVCTSVLLPVEDSSETISCAQPALDS